jgi:hypothetical protein
VEESEDFLPLILASLEGGINPLFMSRKLPDSCTLMDFSFSFLLIVTGSNFFTGTCKTALLIKFMPPDVMLLLFRKEYRKMRQSADIIWFTPVVV